MRDLLQETQSFWARERARLEQQYGVRSAAVFGSLARGEATGDSDVDILVEMESPTFDRYMDLKFELEDRLGVSVDLVLKDALKDRLRDSIQREAVHV
jgi:predicted nucleotidyltransferase